MEMLDPNDSSSYDIVEWESWIEAGRWMLKGDLIRDGIFYCNQVLIPKGWKPIELVYDKEYTTFMNRKLYFKISGQRYAVRFFQKCLFKATGVY